ncbi:hypothetical protein GGI59_002991 [Rhizobium lentis]|uniref:Uncharacterized protein n=1 Tax=Rhizobium lentis TaxID=1138194 RepID=A0A7W8UNL3_9HYPH|nr:hypothetical protein [Rhizobium lentis]MBB5550562.1 hypothetical protein [Rhizobium lentis]MBB5561316.1 hypothetical protein [Rhizobium lentis]MBB5567681.1 hypothetical protein [Rhizobium lentis]
MKMRASRWAVDMGLARKFLPRAAISLLIALPAGTDPAMAQTAEGAGIRAQLVSRSATLLSSEVAGRS